EELAVISAMLLVACSVPTQGLLRFFLPELVMPFWIGQQDTARWLPLLNLNLPEWLFPVETIRDGRTDRVVEAFYSRLFPGEAFPAAAWLRTLLGWSPFILGWMAALLALAVMLVPQWARNERLPFPLTQIQLSII